MPEISDRLNQSIREVTVQTGKYLMFTLADESYGVGVLKVKEIIGMLPITAVPGTLDFIKGMINLRGKVIPVADLRLKFTMPPAPYSERTCIIVLEIDRPSGTDLLGIIVDTVSEVLNIQEKNIEVPPAFGATLDTDYILGMAKTDSGVKILLHIDQVFNTRMMSNTLH